MSAPMWPFAVHSIETFRVAQDTCVNEGARATLRRRPSEGDVQTQQPSAPGSDHATSSSPCQWPAASVALPADALAAVRWSLSW